MPPSLEPTPQTPPKHSRFIERIEQHPYFAVTLATLLMCAIGIAIILERSSESTGGSTAWGGVGTISIFGDRTANRPNAEAEVGANPNVELGYIPLPTFIGDEEGTEPVAALTELLALLAQPTGNGGAPATETTLGAYSFIPQGLISPESPVKTQSATQAALYVYGNQVGSFVKAFESDNFDTSSILKNHAEDRTNAEKQEIMRRLGTAYAQLGYDLERIDPVPESIKAAHAAYATTYRIVGTNLIKIANTENDEAFLDAVTTFNESSDALTKRFVMIATIFGANNVTFSSSDTGSIFMFSPTLSL